MSQQHSYYCVLTPFPGLALLYRLVGNYTMLTNFTTECMQEVQSKLWPWPTAELCAVTVHIQAQQWIYLSEQILLLCNDGDSLPTKFRDDCIVCICSIYDIVTTLEVSWKFIAISQKNRWWHTRNLWVNIITLNCHNRKSITVHNNSLY